MFSDSKQIKNVSEELSRNVSFSQWQSLILTQPIAVQLLWECVDERLFRSTAQCFGLEKGEEEEKTVW